MSAQPRVGILGGTGPEGRGIATRLAMAGIETVIGSREAPRGKATAKEVLRRLASVRGSAQVTGTENLECARTADLLFLAVPYAGQNTLLDALAAELQGKIVINVIAPLQFKSGVARFAPPPAGSAAEEAAGRLPAARWVAGLHTVPASELEDPSASLLSDALICGDDGEAKAEAVSLMRLVDGLRPVDAGPLLCARYLEGATALLININKIHRIHGSLRIVGL